MFKKSLLGPHQSIVLGCDPGGLVESLLFYEEVILVAHRGGLQQLIGMIGLDNFKRLLTETHLKFVLQRDSSATVSSGGFHSFCTIQMSGGSQGIMNNEELIFETFFRGSERRGASKRATNQLLDKMEFITTGDDFSPGIGIPKIATDKVLIPEIGLQAIPKVIAHIAPEYPLAKGCKFEVSKTDNGLIVSSDIDYDLLNQAFKKQYPHADYKFEESSFFTQFVDAVADMYISSQYGASIKTNPLAAVFIESLINDLQKTAKSSDAEIQLFQEEITENGKTISEAINSGERGFSEAFELINEAEQFRSWASKIDEDSSLIKEYVASISSVGFLEQLPIKRLRFLVTTVLGLMHPVIGIAAGTADSFLLDKIVKGWKPDVFVNDKLNKFVKKHK